MRPGTTINSTPKQPLLIEGFRIPNWTSNASGGATFNKQFIQDRGKVKWIDFLVVSNDGTYKEADLLNLKIGSTDVLQNVLLNTLAVINPPAQQIKLIPTDVAGGQSFNVQFITAPGGFTSAVYQTWLHAFHENIYDTPEFRRKFYDVTRLHFHREDFAYVLNGNTIEISEPFTIPKDRGKVIAIKISALMTQDDAASYAFSLQVNNVDLITNANMSIFSTIGSSLISNRSSVYFPVLIEGGSTMKFQVQDFGSAKAAGDTICVSLYFDAE